MILLAHAGSIVQTVLYLAPLGFLVVVLLRTKSKDRRAGDEEQEAELTLDEVMDDKP